MTTPTWTVDDLPNLSGKTFVVTGASSGLGEMASRALAHAGARVVLAVRDTGKGERIGATIEGETEVRELDVSSLASVRRFAAEWTGPLDVLVNNAGIMATPFSRTEDGFESQIGTNYLGHFALTNLLMPHITDRVVDVSSLLNRLGHIDLADLNWSTRAYRPWASYSQSKLASLLFSMELQRRLSLSGSSVKAIAAHPGVARTSLNNHLRGPQSVLMGLVFAAVGKPASKGVLPVLFAATQDLPGDSYIGPGRNGPTMQKRTRAELDAAVARRLWTLSAELTQTDLPV